MVVLVGCKLGVLHSLAEVARRIVVGEGRRSLRAVVMVLHSLVVGIAVVWGHRKAAVEGIAAEEELCSLPAEEVVRYSLLVEEAVRHSLPVELRTSVEEERIRFDMGIVVVARCMVLAEGSLLELEDIADRPAEGNLLTCQYHAEALSSR